MVRQRIWKFSELRIIGFGLFLYRVVLNGFSSFRVLLLLKLFFLYKVKSISSNRVFFIWSEYNLCANVKRTFRSFLSYTFDLSIWLILVIIIKSILTLANKAVKLSGKLDLSLCPSFNFLRSKTTNLDIKNHHIYVFLWILHCGSQREPSNLWKKYKPLSKTKKGTLSYRKIFYLVCDIWTVINQSERW